MAVGHLREDVISLQQRVEGVEKNVDGVEWDTKDKGEDINGLGRNFDKLEGIVENLDNPQRRNNIEIRGLKEREEGEDQAG